MKKNKKIQNISYKTDEQQEIIRFIIILAVVVALVVAVYFFTKYVVKGKKIDFSDSYKDGSINYSMVTVGTMLNKSDKNYYVLVYNSESNDAGLYEVIVGKYSEKEDALPIYICDLNNSLNKDYIAKDKTNPQADTISDLALGELTLIKVNKGKITKYLENLDDIYKEFGMETES